MSFGCFVSEDCFSIYSLLVVLLDQCNGVDTNGWSWMQVQRSLQLRIEAQGKYLQSILEKAKETLAGHASSSPGLEAAHAELTELASKVSNDPLGQSFSWMNLPGINNPESLQHAVDPRGGASSLPRQQQLPRQQSRVSDSSSQKSYLTSLTANPEDSGGASGCGEQQAATGKKRACSSCTYSEDDDGEGQQMVQLREMNANFPPMQGSSNARAEDRLAKAAAALKGVTEWKGPPSWSVASQDSLSLSAGIVGAEGAGDKSSPADGSMGRSKETISNSHAFMMKSSEGGASALERPTPRRGTIQSLAEERNAGGGSPHTPITGSSLQVTTKYCSNMGAPHRPAQTPASTNMKVGGALDLNYGNGISMPRGSELDLNTRGWER
jgi:hypothetical protein